MLTSHPAKTRSPAPAAPVWDLPLPLMLLAVLAIAIAAWIGTLGYFFAQDDFAGLARASGALPRLVFPWRWISGQLYFDVMHALAGLDPRPYRLVSLAVHATNAVLLALFLARRYSPTSALVGAALLAAHPAAFTAVYSISGIGELLATGFALLTLLLFEARGARVRALTLATFGAALLCKETVLLLPLVFAFVPRRGGSVRRRDPLVPAMVVLAIAFALVLVLGDTFGVRGGLAADAAYSAGFGTHVFANLLTYSGWSLDLVAPLVTSFTDAADRRVWPLGVAWLLAMLAACAWSPTRERGALAAVAWWLAPIVFVLPLRHHTYHYYLTTALVGLGWLCASVLDTIQAHAATGASVRARMVGGALLLAGAITWSGAIVIRKVEHHPFIDPRMRSDPTVDRARIAARVRDGLAKASLPGGTRLTFWSPRVLQPSLTRAQAADTTRDTYWETNVQSALLDGLAVRVLFPELGATRFVRTHVPDSSSRWAIYGCDGLTRVVTDAGLGAMLRQQPEIR